MWATFGRFDDSPNGQSGAGRQASRLHPTRAEVSRRGRFARLRPPAWLLSAVAVLTVVVAFLWLDKSQLHWYAAAGPAPATPTAPVVTPTVEPDRVVGVIRKCEAADELALRVVALEGCGTELASLLRILNDRLEVTVRTSSGGSYVVTTGPTVGVHVGDVWPLR